MRPVWVVQSGAFHQSDFNVLRSAVTELGCRFEALRIVPFSHEPVGALPEIDGPCIVYGSSGLLSLARRVGWQPAGWDGPAFSVRRVTEALGPLALNSDAIWTPYSRAAETLRDLGWEQAFIRPDDEQKEFAGGIRTPAQLEKDISRLMAVDYFARDDNLVVLARPRMLCREWRAFVVDGRIVETSLYANDGCLREHRGAPEAVIAVVGQATASYQPAPAFTVDVAEVEEGETQSLRIVEYNSLNSSAFYGCSISKIAAAVTELASQV